MSPSSPSKRKKGSAKSAKVSPESESSRTDSEQSPSYSDNSDSDISEDGVGPTPRKNALKGSTVATKVKERASKAAPDGQRCLLTLEDRPAIQACHLISVSKTKQKILQRLEYFWGLKSGHLNLHSRWNLLYLRADVHFSFDQNDWALIPTEPVLKKIHDSLFLSVRNETQPRYYLEEFPEECWDYHFRPLHSHPWRPIFRHNVSEDDNPRNRSFHDRKGPILDYQTFLPPFDTFPLLKSHVHPFFAIYNAGKKLVGSVPLPEEYRETTRLVEEIYSRWMSLAIPDLVKKDRHTPPATSRSGPSGATSSLRTRSSTKRRREEDRNDPQPPESGPSPKKSKHNSTKRGRGRTDLPCPSSASTPELAEASSRSDSIHNKSSSHTRVEPDADGGKGEDPLSPPLPFWETIPNWVDQNTKATAKDDVASSVENYPRDVEKYQREKVRKPPPETSWANWNVEWANARGVVDPRTYGRGWSSNDWARWWKDTLLPRSLEDN